MSHTRPTFTVNKKLPVEIYHRGTVGLVAGRKRPTGAPGYGWNTTKAMLIINTYKVGPLGCPAGSDRNDR